MSPPDPAKVAADAARALAEDLGGGDLCAGLIPPGQQAVAAVICRDGGILCGSDWFKACFLQLDPDSRIDFDLNDGDPIAAGQRLCTVTAGAWAMLAAERSALNFLQTLSGTATAARRLVAQLAALQPRPPAVLLDTRKTVPGLRYAQKYATRIGGFANHRMGLYDRVLLKENHLIASGSIAKAIGILRRKDPALWIAVEVENESQISEAAEAGAQRVLLDNFLPAELTAAVRRWQGRIEIEVSGGVDAENLAAIAMTGVDYISIGAVTKHLRALDLSLRHVSGPVHRPVA